MNDSINSKIYYDWLKLVQPYTDEVLFLENSSDMKGSKPQQINDTFIEEIIRNLTSSYARVYRK